MANIGFFNRILVLLGLFLIISGCENKLCKPPYPFSQSINTFKLDWATHRRLALGSDNWPLTWGKDDHQYTSWGDGGGFQGSNQEGRVSLGIARIEGDDQNYHGINIWGGVSSSNTATFTGKSYGILSVDKDLYLWVSPGSNEEAYQESRLYFSGDSGASWSSVDWTFDSSYSFVNPFFLQFGRGYEHARDGYVYTYAARVKDDRALKVQIPGEIILFRVAKSSLLIREDYEFFAGIDTDGAPIWSQRFTESRPVFFDINGVGWASSVSFNRPLNRYFLITEHSSTMRGNVGVFTSESPWGPWETVYYGKFDPNNQIANTTFYYNFSNKWLDKTGRNFTLVFTGINENDSWNSIRGEFQLK